MLDLGWLRSGSYLYRTCNDKTCCPNIPIRCAAVLCCAFALCTVGLRVVCVLRLNVREFVLSKQHKKVLKRMEQYLSGERPMVPVKDASVSMGAATPVKAAARKPVDATATALSLCMKRLLMQCRSDGIVAFDDSGLLGLTAVRTVRLMLSVTVCHSRVWSQVRKPPPTVSGVDYSSAVVLRLAKDAAARPRLAAFLRDKFDSLFNCGTPMMCNLHDAMSGSDCFLFVLSSRCAGCYGYCGWRRVLELQSVQQPRHQSAAGCVPSDHQSRTSSSACRSRRAFCFECSSLQRRQGGLQHCSCCIKHAAGH